MEETRTFTKKDIEDLMNGHTIRRDRPFMKKDECEPGLHHVLVNDENGKTYPMDLYYSFTYSDVDGCSEEIFNFDTDYPTKPHRRIRT